MVSQHASQVILKHALQQVSRGEGVVSQHALQVSRPTPKGGSSEVWPGGVSRSRPGGVSRPTSGGVSRLTPGGGLQAHTRGSPEPHPQGVSMPTPGVSQHALRQNPKWLLLQTVCILLECTLVVYISCRI